MQKIPASFDLLRKVPTTRRQGTSLHPLTIILYPLIVAGVLYGVRYIPLEIRRVRPAATVSATAANAPSDRPERHHEDAGDSVSSATPYADSGNAALAPPAPLTPTASVTAATAALASRSAGAIGRGASENDSIASAQHSPTTSGDSTAFLNPSGVPSQTTGSAPLAATVNAPPAAASPASTYLHPQVARAPEPALAADLSSFTGELTTLRTLWQHPDRSEASPSSSSEPPTQAHPAIAAMDTQTARVFARTLTRGAGVNDNLIANPSFEDAPDHYNRWTTALGTTAFGGGQDIRALGSSLTNTQYGQPAGGSYNAVLFNDSSQCLAGQAVTLIAGTTYSLAFDTLTTTPTNSGSATFSVYFGTALPASRFTIDAMTLQANVGFATITQTTISASNPHPVNAMPLVWTTAQETFTSTQSGVFYLTFLQTGPGITGSDSNFDRIALLGPSASSTPEPSSLALLARLCLTALPVLLVIAVVRPVPLRALPNRRQTRHVRR